MNQVVYASAAVAPFSETQLTELLARARTKNDGPAQAPKRL
jgi:hypothetical protein